MVDGETRVPHKASVMSSTRRTETYISIRAPSTELSRRRSRADISDAESLPKNGLLLTNLRVVPVSGAYLKYAPYLGHGKVRVQQFSEKSEWSWLWGPKPGMPGCVAPDHLQTTG